MPQRVLILSASVGAGHLRAAEALELAFREIAPDAHVENVDALTLTTRAFRRVYGKGYLDLVSRVPAVFGYIYERMDRPKKKGRRFSKGDRLRMLVERVNMRPFVKLVRDGEWDVIVNTHFLSAEIVALLRRKGSVETPHVTVTTDFETHRLWVSPPCEHYYVASEEGAALLEYWDVPAGDITIAGIPIHPVFSRPKSRGECLEAQGLKGDRPVVLQLAGGFGVGPIEAIYRAILSIDVPLEVAVVSGRNEKLKNILEKVEVPERHRAKVLGFTTEMDELMGAADIVVSKPGGLTTSEALARGAPLAIVNPIPGQETRNSDFLLENGAAVKINNTVILPQKLASVLGNPKRLAALKRSAKRLAKPRAAFDIAQHILSLCR